MVLVDAVFERECMLLNQVTRTRPNAINIDLYKKSGAHGPK